MLATCEATPTFSRRGRCEKLWVEFYASYYIGCRIEDEASWAK